MRTNTLQVQENIISTVLVEAQSGEGKVENTIEILKAVFFFFFPPLGVCLSGPGWGSSGEGQVRIITFRIGGHSKVKILK